MVGINDDIPNRKHGKPESLRSKVYIYLGNIALVVAVTLCAMGFLWALFWMVGSLD